MSRFIPQTKGTPQPKWVYLANPQSGEVTRVKRVNFMELMEYQDKGYARTSREIYQRAYANKFSRGRSMRAAFTPTEYPSKSGRYIASNIFYQQ